EKLEEVDEIEKEIISMQKQALKAQRKLEDIYESVKVAEDFRKKMAELEDFYQSQLINLRKSFEESFSLILQENNKLRAENENLRKQIEEVIVNFNALLKNIESRLNDLHKIIDEMQKKEKKYYYI
ncbi:MAG: hypothetical protein QW648_02085, partial [Nanoarchaeales archaeon]